MASLDKYKLTSVTWDSDKEPQRFIDFMFLMSALVRAIDHGAVLEDLLDKKLQRSRYQSISTPTFLTDDPEFIDMEEGPKEAEKEMEGEVPSSPASYPGTTSKPLGSAGVNYHTLEQDAKDLDAMLYNVLKMNTKGSKRTCWIVSHSLHTYRPCVPYIQTC